VGRKKKKKRGSNASTPGEGSTKRRGGKFISIITRKGRREGVETIEGGKNLH